MISSQAAHDACISVQDRSTGHDACTQFRRWHIHTGQDKLLSLSNLCVAFRGRGGIGSRADEAGPFLPASAAAGTLIPIPMCCRPFLPLYEVHCTDFASVASSLGDYAEVLIHTGLLELWVLKHSLRSACHTQPQHVLASCVELPLNTICDLLGLSTTSPGHAEQFEGNM